MMNFKRTVLTLSTLSSITACSTPAPNINEFNTKGVGNATIGAAANATIGIGNNFVGTWNGKNVYKDNIGLYYIVISGRTYLCKFSPSWIDSLFGMTKCK